MVLGKRRKERPWLLYNKPEAWKPTQLVLNAFCHIKFLMFPITSIIVEIWKNLNVPRIAYWNNTQQLKGSALDTLIFLKAGFKARYTI